MGPLRKGTPNAAGCLTWAEPPCSIHASCGVYLSHGKIAPAHCPAAAAAAHAPLPPRGSESFKQATSLALPRAGPTPAAASSLPMRSPAFQASSRVDGGGALTQRRVATAKGAVGFLGRGGGARRWLSCDACRLHGRRAYIRGSVCACAGAEGGGATDPLPGAGFLTNLRLLRQAVFAPLAALLSFCVHGALLEACHNCQEVCALILRTAPPYLVTSSASYTPYHRLNHQPPASTSQHRRPPARQQHGAPFESQGGRLGARSRGAPAPDR